MIEHIPNDARIRQFVDRYQVYVIESPCFFKTIPNGRIEAWIITGGGFEIFDEVNNSFVQAKNVGGYPASTHSLLLRVPESMRVLNVKFKMSALIHDSFRSMYPVGLDFQADRVFSPHMIDQILQRNEDLEVLKPSFLDTWIAPIFKERKENQDMLNVLQVLENEPVYRVDDLAEKLCLTSKTLERRVTDYFGMTPKQLLNILRFNRFTATKKKGAINKLIDAMSFGYYDQPHFTKECRRITGLSPKKFFSSLKFSTNDLIVNEFVDSV